MEDGTQRKIRRPCSSSSRIICHRWPARRGLTRSGILGRGSRQGRDAAQRLDCAAARVAASFADRPLAEATVRELLGSAYLQLNQAALAVKQYELAFALREGVEGIDHPDTAVCRNQLAVAYRLAGRTEEAAELFDQSPSRSHPGRPRSVVAPPAQAGRGRAETARMPGNSPADRARRLDHLANQVAPGPGPAGSEKTR